MDIKIEEQKMKCLQLTNKILDLENPKEKKKNRGPTKEEVETLNTLLDIYHNRVVFLQRLSEYRNKGKFDIKQETFDILNYI